METIIFHIGNKQEKENVLSSLASIFLECSRDINILFAIKENLYLDIRNSDQFNPKIREFNEILYISYKKEAEIPEKIREVVKDYNQLLFFINGKHILRPDSLKEMRLSFNEGHFGYVGNTIWGRILEFPDIYNKPNLKREVVVSLEPRQYVDCICDATFITTRQNFDYYGHSMIDFSKRLRQLGFRNLLNQNILLGEG